MFTKMRVLSIVMLLSLIVSACGPAATPQIIKETVVVKEEVIVEGTPVIKETVKEIVITATPEPAKEPAPAAATYDRKETIYVSGSAWGPPSTWNPFQPGSLANTTGTLGYVYETLYAFDPMTGKLTPWLAESGEWTDDNTYVVKLRSGLTWSDGQPLTSADVKFTFDLGSKIEAIWFSPMWRYLTEVTAPDDLTVQFAFNNPLYQEFMNNLYNIPIVPQHLWEGRSDEDTNAGANENPVGSGAYLYETHSEDRNVWVRNENWWGIDVFGKPAPKRIVDIRTSSNNVALGMVVKGELDLSNNFLPGVATLANKGYVQTYYKEAPYMLSANTAVLFLNTTIKPMDDPAFRRALAHAINVDDIVNVAYASLVRAASPTGLLPTLSKYDDADVLARLGYGYDPDKAVAILTEAGYTKGTDGFFVTPDGAKIELEVTCPFGWTDWMEAINVIANSAQEAGINIKAVTPDYGAWNTALQSGTFHMTLNNWAAMSNTPWTLYNLLFRHPIQEQMQSGNFGRYENQELFDLVDALAKVKSTDEAGMKEACKNIQEVMLTEVPMIPLWYNGLWAQFSGSTWTNWPTEAADTPETLPTTWSGYWQLGGLETLINLKPAE
jgi:peptide/nickel transport system substrate-binding protein